MPDGNVVLTPSSLDYRTMTLDDLVVCDLDGNVVEGTRNPTSEKMLHLSALAQASRRRRDDALPREVLHDVRAHPPAHPGRHRRSPGVPRGRRAELPSTRRPVRSTSRDEVSEHLADRAAVLMANHGLFVVARNPMHSLELAQLVELTAEIVWGASLLGEIVPLPDDVVEKFSGYYRMGRTPRP